MQDSLSFLQRLLELGFTNVTFDMARGVSITAWRGNERKTYSVYFQPTLADAEFDLLQQVCGPLEQAPIGSGFEDLI